VLRKGRLLYEGNRGVRVEFEVQCGKNYHQYAKVDDFRVFEILHENLDDFDDYAAAVTEYLQRDELDNKDS